MPKVTIGVPFYNIEAKLGDAIKSVFAQTFQDWELILADDGSSDSSLAIAESVDDPRVKVISDGKNLGRSGRRNHIIDIAQGKYLAWLDADDMMHPDRLAAQVELLESDPRLDVVDAAMYGIQDYEPLAVTYTHKMIPTAASALKRSLVAQGVAMGRIEWFRNNPSNVALKTSEDFSLWARTVGHSHFARVPKALLFYTEATFTPRATLAKYQQSQRDTRAVIGTYGPAMVGWPETVKRLAASHAKVLLYTCFTAIGQQRRLINARGVLLNESEKQQAREVIAAIRSTIVPGLMEYKQTP